MKIAVIGYSGAGKSTLAKQLGEKYSAPVLYLDKVNFEAGWKERSRDECITIAEAFMEKESWIIDGNYSMFSQEKRLSQADRIIFMDFKRTICFMRAFRRYLGSRNRCREDMAEGCNEKFDLEFALWILIRGRTRKYTDRYQNICRRFQDKVIVCKNTKDVQAVLNLDLNKYAH